MRRIITVILLIALSITGCVHADTVYVEGKGYMPVASGVPALPEAATEPDITPSSEEQHTLPVTPKPTLPASTNSPTERPATPAPALPPTPSSEPEPETENPPAPETADVPEKGPVLPKNDIKELPEEKRLYLHTRPAIAGKNMYSFSGGVYTELELNIFCKLAALQQWSSLGEVMSLFGTTLYPDIRLCDFSEGLFAPSLSVSSEPFYNEVTGIATITLRHDDALAEDRAEYTLLFQKAEDGYRPLRVTRETVGDAGERLHEQWIQEIGSERFYVTITEEGNGNERVLRERWYSYTDYELLLSFVYKGECSSEYLFEQYETRLEEKDAKLTDFGFILPAHSEALLQFEGMEGSPTPITVGAQQEFTVYYNRQEASFYVDVDKQEFFADHVRIEPGQYKYIFGAELAAVVEAARHPLEVAWATDLLEAPDWEVCQPEPPMEEERYGLPTEQANIRVIPFDFTKPSRQFTQRTLQAFVEDIRNMRESSFMQLAQQYAIYVKPQLGEEGGDTENPPFDIKWSDIKKLSCSLDITTAHERIAVIQLSYTERAKQKILLLCFTLETNAWQPSCAYSFTAESSSSKLYYRDGLLYCTYTQEIRNRQPVDVTLVLDGGSLLATYISSYQGKDGTVYTLAFQKAASIGRLTGMFTISAVRKGEEKPVLKYKLPVWEQDGWCFSNDADAGLLLYGQIEKHEGFIAALKKVDIERKERAEWIAQAIKDMENKNEEKPAENVP